MDIEALRRTFRPDETVILFVGESPAANGSFFYKSNSQVFRYMRDAFSAVCAGGIEPTQFLEHFKSVGCYLEDLVLTPVNKANPNERKRARKAGICGLAMRIRNLSPRHVVAIARTIHSEVKEAVDKSGTGAVFHCVSFPGTGRQREFLQQIAALLPSLLQSGQL
jgi:hypothetical protein